MTNLTYVDRLDVNEVFADHIAGMKYELKVLRVEFQVTRQTHVSEGLRTPESLCRLPAARLVLTRDAMLQLYDQLHSIVERLKASGEVGSAQSVTSRRQ